ncbi:MAG: hypothetical protein AABW48_05105 [Nanoarchaeota archaeon]
MDKLKVSKDNDESRMLFVDYWANFVRGHSDQEWGEQQKRLIDSQMQSAKHSSLTPKQYLKLKEKN